MTKLDELKAAYNLMADECCFLCVDAVFNDDYGEENWKLVFRFFGVGIRMSFSYEYFVESDPSFDDIILNDDPYFHFSIDSFRIIRDFIETMQKYRKDKDTFQEFVNYLKEEAENNSEETI